MTKEIGYLPDGTPILFASVRATLSTFTLVVKTCPFCGKTHHHAKSDQYHYNVKSKCGKGYYYFETVTEPMP
jgi:hypothetical protein